MGAFVAALIVAVAGEGLAGLADIAKRCSRWRVPLRWYAAAVFIPAGIGIGIIVLNVLLGAPPPTAAQLGPWYSLLVLFPIALFDAPLWEESAWRGFALPRFPVRLAPLVNTLILAILLVLWHLPRAMLEPELTLPYVLSAFGSAILTNWVYYNARESALLAILYHSVANTFGLYFSPMLAGPDLIRYFWLLAAFNLTLAAIVVLVSGSNFGRQSVNQEERRQVIRPSSLK